MEKKIICLVLALTMALSLFACAGKSEPNVSESREPAENVTPTAAASTIPDEASETPLSVEEPDNSQESEQPEEPTELDEAGVSGYSLPLFEEVKTFSYWKCLPDISVMVDGFYDNVAYQYMVEALGVELDFISCAGTVEKERFNIMIASGDYPHMIANIANLYSGSFDSLIDDEVLIDISGLVNSNMPLYKAALDEGGDSYYLQATTEGGAMAAVCTIVYDGPAASQYGPVIRQDWLNELGLEIPVTYDELTETARAFKTELGATEAIHYLGTYDFCEGFGVLGFNFNFNPFAKAYQGFYLKDGTSEVTFGIIEDGYREYIELIRAWFAEGLISQEFASRNQNRNGSEATAARYGDYCGVFGVDPTVMDTIEAEHQSPGFEMTPITYPVKSGGDTIHLAERSETVYPYLALTTACEDTKSAAVFLDWWFSDEGNLLRNYGVEGITYNLDDSGKPQYTELYTENDGSLVSNAEFSQYYFFPLISGLEPANTLDPAQYSEKSVNATGVWYSNMDDAWYLPSLSLSGEAGEAFTAKFGDITTCCAENVFKFIYGERPMDEWDDFLVTLDDLGINECIAAWQSAYDAYISRLS